MSDVIHCPQLDALVSPPKTDTISQNMCSVAHSTEHGHYLISLHNLDVYVTIKLLSDLQSPAGERKLFVCIFNLTITSVIYLVFPGGTHNEKSSSGFSSVNGD